MNDQPQGPFVALSTGKRFFSTAKDIEFGKTQKSWGKCVGKFKKITIGWIGLFAFCIPTPVPNFCLLLGSPSSQGPVEEERSSDSRLFHERGVKREREERHFNVLGVHHCNIARGICRRCSE